VKVYIVTEWHDAETKDIVGVYLYSAEAVTGAGDLCAKWNAECPGRDKDGNRHVWTRNPTPQRVWRSETDTYSTRFAEWGSVTAWSGIYITEHLACQAPWTVEGVRLVRGQGAGVGAKIVLAILE
jgi:hypothetical protein